jgi:FkbM family methyltransferase
MNRKTRVIFAILTSASIGALLGGYVGVKAGIIYMENFTCCGTPRSANLFLTLKELTGLIKFNSQLGQDRWIVQRVFPGVRDGYFVDVGSGDGLFMSNSKVLEELGWNGVCIDPFPENMTKRTCTMFKEIVDSEAGRKVDFRVAGFFGGIEGHLGTHKDKTADSRTIELTTTTLEDILARAKAPKFIHYVSIDIEGAELAALRGFPFSKYKVGAFTIEHSHEEPKRSQIKALLESNGYRRTRVVKHDDFYVLNEDR